MSELQAQLREWRAAFLARLPTPPPALVPHLKRGAIGFGVVFLFVFPLFFTQTSGFLNTTIIALAYVVMALGLNVVVGFAGLLDLGYVAFYAFGAYSAGWFGSTFFFNA